MKLIEKAKIFVQKFTAWISRQNEPVAPLQWLLVLSVMIAIRTFLIFAAQGLPDRPGMLVAIFYFQDFFFFLDALLLAWIWLALFLRVKPQALSRLMLWGTWLVVIPPIIDLIGYGKIFWSFYLFNDIQGLWTQYYSIFGHLPPAIVYFGSKIACILAVIATSIFVYYRTRKTWKALVNGWVIYSIFFLMGSFPSWLSYGYYFLAKGKSLLVVTIADVAGFIASPVELFGIKYQSIGWMTMIKLNLVYFLFSVILLLLLVRLSEKGRIKALVGKFFAESPFYLHLASFLFGFGILGFGLFPQNFSAGFFSWFAMGALWMSIAASLLADKLLFGAVNSGKKEAAPSWEAISLLSIISLSGFFVVGIKFLLLALVYRALWVLYYRNPFGLGSVWALKYFLKWTALFLSMLFGFMLMSQDQALEHFPLKMGLWLTLGLLTVFSWKNGQVADEEELGGGIFSHTVRKMAGEVFVFCIFMSGFFVMHKPSLFWWALFLGGVSFWAIEKEHKSASGLIRAAFLIYLCLGLVIL